MPQWWAYGLLFSVCSSVSCMIYCSICDHLCMYMYLRTIIYEPRCIPVWLRSLHIPLWYLCIYKCRSCIFYTALIFQPGTLYVKGCMQAGSAYFCSNWMGKWWQLVGKAAMKWMASDGLTFCLLRCGTSSVLTFLCSHYFNRYTYNWLCFGFVAVSTAAIGDSNQVLPRTATTKHTTTTTTTTNTPASSSTVTSTTPTATATSTTFLTGTEYCFYIWYSGFWWIGPGMNVDPLQMEGTFARGSAKLSQTWSLQILDYAQAQSVGPYPFLLEKRAKQTLRWPCHHPWMSSESCPKPIQHTNRGITSERDILKVQSKTSTANVDHHHSTRILTVKFHRPFASLALSKKSSSNRKLAARLMVDWAWQQAKRRILWFALVSFGSTVLLEVLLLGNREVVTICCKSHWFSISTLGHDKHHGLISVLVLISRLEGATRQAGGNSKSAIVALALTVGEPLGETLSTGQNSWWMGCSLTQPTRRSCIFI